MHDVIAVAPSKKRAVGSESDHVTWPVGPEDPQFLLHTYKHYPFVIVTCRNESRSNRVS
jgi:hypothetical protein